MSLKTTSYYPNDEDLVFRQEKPYWTIGVGNGPDAVEIHLTAEQAQAVRGFLGQCASPSEKSPADLPTCPREDCTATARHFHRSTAVRPDVAVLCSAVPAHCRKSHDGSWVAASSRYAASSRSVSRCYAPRTPQPQPTAVVLPTLHEAVSRVLTEMDRAMARRTGQLHELATDFQAIANHTTDDPTVAEAWQEAARQVRDALNNKANPYRE